jgi:hypothetical protein
MPTASWYEIEKAPSIAQILIQQPNLRPGSESISDLIRNIYQREYNIRISNAGIAYVKRLYENMYAVPATVRGVDMFEGDPVEAYPLRDGQILEQLGRYEPGNPDKKFGNLKQMLGITSKPIARPLGGTRRRRRSKKSFKKNRRHIKKNRKTRKTIRKF